MGSNILTSDETQENRGVSDKDTSFSIAKMFDECFPIYMAIGMTPYEYWDGEPSLVSAYRKADEIRRKRANYEMWMQGRYIYDGIMRLIPSLNMWKPKKPLDYMTEPYPLSEEELKDREMREAKKKQEEMKEQMRQYAMSYNARQRGQDNG